MAVNEKGETLKVGENKRKEKLKHAHAIDDFLNVCFLCSHCLSLPLSLCVCLTQAKSFRNHDKFLIAYKIQWKQL